jgi:tetratricopeptide (TPR) repeat protein
LGDDSKGAYDKIDEAIAKEPSAKALRLQVRGKFYKDYAWEARGNGYVDTVTEEGFRKFGERLQEAGKALEAAWKLRPDDGKTATLMLIVELGIGDGDRDRMELWFRRALEADPDNKDACLNKLYWLEPKWHGSSEAMLAFGRACRDTKNWRSGIPLLLPDAHYRLTRYLDAEERLKYLGAPSFWDDVHEVYTEYLKRMPNDTLARTDFAAFCYASGHRVAAHEQFAILGDRLVPSERFPEPWLKQVRETCAKAAADQKPAAKD